MVIFKITHVILLSLENKYLRPYSVYILQVGKYTWPDLLFLM